MSGNDSWAHLFPCIYSKLGSFNLWSSAVLDLCETGLQSLVYWQCNSGITSRTLWLLQPMVWCTFGITQTNPLAYPERLLILTTCSLNQSARLWLGQCIFQCKSANRSDVFTVHHQSPAQAVSRSVSQSAAEILNLKLAWDTAFLPAHYWKAICYEALF